MEHDFEDIAGQQCSLRPDGDIHLFTAAVHMARPPLVAGGPPTEIILLLCGYCTRPCTRRLE